jgi:hypothetical protein
VSLNFPLRALRGLLVLSFLGATRVAAADVQACVAHNNDGADRRASQQLLAARVAYRACVAEPGCPDVVRSECEAALSELRTSIPTLLVSILDEQQHDVIGATLKVDGRAVAVDGTPIEVEPGPHELVATGQGIDTAVQVVAVEHEVNRQVVLVLKAQLAQPTVEPETALAAESKPRSRVPSLVLAGVGAVAAGSFGYFALSGHSEYSQLEQCKPDCTRSAVHEVRVKYLLADVSLGVSVLAFASAGYLFFSAPRERVAARDALSVALTASPQTAGISLRWEQ